MSDATPSIPKSHIGVVLVLVYFVLMFLAAIQNPTAFDTSPFFWMAVASLIGASVYFLYCVWGLHKALRAATGGAYAISPIQALGFHFVPFYVFYWAFRWTGEAARFVAAATPEKKILFWLPGVLMLLGFVAGQALDAGFSALTNLLVVGWLARLVRNALANPEAVSSYQQSGWARKLNAKKHGIAVGICVIVAVAVTAINVVGMRTQLGAQNAAPAAGAPLEEPAAEPAAPANP